MLRIDHFTLEFPTKTCFREACVAIESGERIALIGDNGSGKSTLLKALIDRADHVSVGYLEQQPLFSGTVLEAALEAGGEPWEAEILLDRFGLLPFQNQPAGALSGGEKMRLALVRLLLPSPDLILLDEPTNHLDREGRGLLLAFLESYRGAAVIVTHDEELLAQWGTTIWHIHQQRVDVFYGTYANYCRELTIEQEKELAHYGSLRRKKRLLASSLQQEATRRARTAKQGKKKYSNDKMLRKGCAERAENTQGSSHKKRTIEDKARVEEELKALRTSPLPTPRFHFKGRGCGFIEVWGDAGFRDQMILSNIRIGLQPGERASLTGPNGSGKTTLMRAIQNDKTLLREGEWEVKGTIGYLDQHYRLLDAGSTPYKTIKAKRPDWNDKEIIHHLGAFLFVHHKDLHRPIDTLSEGEKARLSLAQIASSAPDILLLDEITNNLDLTTQHYLIEVLNAYTGTLLINSHSDSFLDALNLDTHIRLNKRCA